MIKIILGQIFGWLLRRFFPSQGQPTAEERAGRAEAINEMQEKVIETHRTAAAARADADERMREEGYDINADPYGYYRD